MKNTLESGVRLFRSVLLVLLTVPASAFGATQETAQDSPDDEVEPFQFSPELVQLLANGSDGYRLGKRQIGRTRDRAVLETLSSGSERHLATMAQRMLQLERLADVVNAVTTYGGGNIEELRRQLNRILAGSTLRDLVGKRDSARWALEELLGKRGLVTRALQASTLAILGTATDHLIRKEVALLLSEHLETCADELPTLPSKKFELRVRREGGLALLGIRNKTGKTLHDCILVLSYQPDRAAVSESFAESRRRFQQQAPAGSFAPQALQAQLQMLDARFVKEYVDKYTVIYLDEWRNKARLELALEEVQAVAFGSKSGSIVVWSKEGRSETLDLPMDAYRKKMVQEHRKMQREQERRRRR
ncbi:MAG: hypothetical protein GY711_23115 [bacterium]|nr:hypothetical protein [bacterium]